VSGDRVPALLAAGGAGWETPLLSALAGSGAVVIVRRCVDVVDLLAVAASGQGRVALVGARLRGLDPDAVDRLHASGVPVVAVVARGVRAEEERMRALGVDYVVPDDADPDVVAGVLVQAARAGVDSDAGIADPSTSMPVLPPGGDPGPADHIAAPAGSVIAVWGPTGAPGRTTVAVTLADEFGGMQRSSLLIDADVYGGTVAAVLGLLDESPGLAAACRQAAGTRLDPAALAALCWQLTPSTRVLTGITLASRWPELRPNAVRAVLAAARRLADFVVVDCGFCLETDEELSFDTLAPRRNGATLAVLQEAARVLAVGAADPVGMQRLVRGLADLADTDIAAPVDVVINQVRRGAVPGNPAEEIAAALQRFAGREPAALLPYDRDAMDTAVASGRLLREARPSSPLRRAVTDLAARLAGIPVSARRRGGRLSG
jgi:MinD-like ATPase involved in chromosome partitioning or flagellar assembly